MNTPPVKATAAKVQTLPVSKKAPAMNIKEKVGMAARMNGLIGKKK